MYYAFYHLTFKEYFAAKAIPDYWDEKRQVPGWDYFMPSNHNQGKPVEGKKYRVLNPRWKEVILLWLGRSDVSEEQKEKFLGVKQIESNSANGLGQLIEFWGGTEDGCGGFYGWKAAFLMVQATAEVAHLGARWKNWVEDQVSNLVEWGFGRHDSEHNSWITSNLHHPVTEISRNNLLAEAHRSSTVDALANLLSLDGIDNTAIQSACESLSTIGQGNQVAIDALLELLM